MKIIKYIFFLLLIAIIGGAVYVATKDGSYQIQESMVIDAPDELLFETISELKTWEKWGPFVLKSEETSIEYSEKTSGQGASINWTNSAQGDGSLKTVKEKPTAEIVQKYASLLATSERESQLLWNFEKLDEKRTKITVNVSGEQSFVEKAKWLINNSTLPETLKPVYQKGLRDLKTYVHNKMAEYTIEVTGLTEHGGGFYMYSAAASTISGIPDKMAQMLPVVEGYVQKNNLPRTGKPFTLFNEFNEALGTSIFSVCIPVRDRVITPSDSNVLCDFLPRQKIVKTVLNGDYKNLKEAWETTMRYIEDNGLIANDKAAAFEIYSTNVDEQPNPAAWITEICIPVIEQQ